MRSRSTKVHRGAAAHAQASYAPPVAARSDIAHANTALATGSDAAHTLAYFALKTGEALYKTGQLERADAAFVQATRCAKASNRRRARR